MAPPFGGASPLCYTFHMLEVTPNRVNAFVHQVSWPTGADDCWLWCGFKNEAGYGGFGGHQAHRVSYEWIIKKIPHPFEVDHLCNVRSCVNPAHMDLVTHSENMYRSWARRD